MIPIHTKVRFGAIDDALRSGVGTSVLPRLHDLSRGSGTCFGFFHCMGDVFESYGKNDISVICISALPNDKGLSAIREEQGAGRRCGVIVRTEDRALWRELSELHAKTPLMFVVAIYGPKKEIPKLFPGARIYSDGGELDLVGEQVARFIWNVTGKEAVSAK
jgi:hypothetical protein